MAKKKPTPKSKLKPVRRKVMTSKKKIVLGAAAIVVIIVTGIFAIQVYKGVNNPVKPLARAVFELAEAQVRTTKPEPTLSGLQYAYVTSVYNDSLAEGGQQGALNNTKGMLQTLYPKSLFDDAFKNLAKAYHLKNPSGSTLGSKVLASYLQRYASDGHTLKWDGAVPAGQEYWYKTKATDPFTPRAGEWKRWLVNAPISVPAPPVFGSAADTQQLEIVRSATAGRSGQDVNDINFWGGTPGTDAPSGIWQNQIYGLVKGDLPKNSKAADTKYAYIQKYAAQAVSDAFMECWKVKYEFWTARPSMRIPGLSMAMADPYFPSYISGHSTISKAAADVLSVMVPAHASQWETYAITARNSRLAAGVHFQIDNTEGFNAGAQVAKQVVSNAHLVRQL